MRRHKVQRALRVLAGSLLLQVLWGALSAEAAPQDKKPPVITHVRVRQAPMGEAVVIRARIDDEGEVFAPAVYVRIAGTEEFFNIDMRKVVDGYEATVPAETVTGSFEYFLEAFDEEGNGPAREGSPEAPIKVQVYDPKMGPPPLPEPVAPVLQPKEPPPKAIVPIDEQEEPSDDSGGVHTKWWFWTIVGVAVTGGIAATVLATRAGGPVDAVDIEIRGPDPGGGL